MNLITKFSLVGATFLTLAACSGEDYSAAEKLPDDTETEQRLPNTEKTDSAADIDNTETEDTTTVGTEANTTDTASILKKYDHLDPKRLINTTALAEAVVYFEKNQSRFKNTKYISLIDFGKRSTQARFFIVNMASGEVWAIHTAHGKGSDSNHDGYAEKFSNKSGSNASSLGYYRAAETYSGKHGLSLKLDGLSSTNSNARARAVVIHGASYVRESSVIQGRSWGCPAVANNLRDKVIGLLKGGSLIYAFAK
ncbi:murein L,D-transpeptidase catalytic domain family protein [Bdellovibrio bacteriovorus]|uniref:murein L,D-transpeptidase catalytic domain family protein n=1 Tax=Bdellovibrio bacteriovorus TaxID=959 RepID=UPI0021D21AA2|nr:murein L,D-transpeptidase catalytic domain family protein [Bdellovibrio bacteriovorus]UXR63925.1 murein L,D-transpeptidase catalytic domain family protein [Bdellovibrio bacteriovorus]